MAEKAKKSKDPITDTALHILKGAIVKVLHTPLTLTTECKSHTKGKISVEYTLPVVPSDHQVTEIEGLANEIIREDVKVEVLKMGRKEAEERYRKEPVNGTFIYDKFPVPESVTELTLIHIKDWNINCCPSEHLSTTGEMGGIKILNLNHRPSKNELEFSFEVYPKGKEVPTKKANDHPQKSHTQASSTTPSSAPKLDITDIAALSHTIVDLVLKETQEGKTEGRNEEETKEKVISQVELLLSSLKNNAYANGFTSKR